MTSECFTQNFCVFHRCVFLIMIRVVKTRLFMSFRLQSVHCESSYFRLNSRKKWWKCFPLSPNDCDHVLCLKNVLWNRLRIVIAVQEFVYSRARKFFIAAESFAGDLYICISTEDHKMRFLQFFEWKWAIWAEKLEGNGIWGMRSALRLMSISDKGVEGSGKPQTICSWRLWIVAGEILYLYPEFFLILILFTLQTLYKLMTGQRQ